MRFESSLGSIYYEYQPKSEGVVLAFFHVLASDHSMFKKQWPRFETTHSVLVWDMPWHGQSVYPAIEFSIATIVEVFVELLDHLGVERVVISGVSMGGYIAQHVALHYPSRVAALHLDSAHPLHLPFNKGVHILMRLHSLGLRVMPKGLISVLASRLLSTDAPSKALIRSHFQTFSRRHLIFLAEGAKYEILKGTSTFPDQATLLTNGAKDFRFIERRNIQAESDHHNVTHVIVSEGGHMHVKTYPSAYESTLRRFLSAWGLNE